MSTTVVELPDCPMRWRTANCNHEAVDLFLKLMLAQKRILYIESDNYLVINCFEQQILYILSSSVFLLGSRNDSLAHKERKAGAGHDSQAARGCGLSNEVYSPTVSKYGEKSMSHDGSLQSRVCIIAQVSPNPVHKLFDLIWFHK